MEKRIFYHDTDAGGVVYYGKYLNILEEARTEFLELKGLNIVQLAQQGIFFAVRHCAISYRSPARYGDTVTCTASLKKLSAAQLIFDQKITQKTTSQLIVDAEVALVSLTKDFRPTPIPEFIKKALTS